MRILVIGPSWVGDMIMAQTLFKVLKKRHPNCQIDVLAPNWSLPLLSRMAEVDQALDLPFIHGDLKLKERYLFAKKLRHIYTQVIVLPGSLKAALIPFWAKIPTRTGFKGEMRYGLLNDLRQLDKNKYKLMIERYMALGMPSESDISKPYPVPNLKVDANNLEQIIKKLQLKLDLPIIALCPGAEFGQAKKWPAKHYAKVADFYLKRNFQVWLFGSKADIATGDEIATQALPEFKNNITNLAGKTSLIEAVDLLSLAQLVISNDSGLMHVAAALKRRIVAIYGSTSPNFTPPLTDKLAVMHTDINCRPCFKRICKFGHYACLQNLDPFKVIEAAQSLEA